MRTLQTPRMVKTSRSRPTEPDHLGWLQVPVDAAHGADRFMALFFPVTSASSISRICGNQSPLGYPDYVTVSARLQAFDTDKRRAAAEAAAGLRWSSGVESIILSGEMRSLQARV